jgi:hypothetical protein
MNKAFFGVCRPIDQPHPIRIVQCDCGRKLPEWTRCECGRMNCVAHNAAEAHENRIYYGASTVIHACDCCKDF